MACMFNKPMLSARKGISPMSTFASAPVLSVPGSRAMSTLGSRPGLFMPKGLGLGLAMRPTLSNNIGAVRNYTDGQLLGNTFLLTTDVSLVHAACSMDGPMPACTAFHCAVP